MYLDDTIIFSKTIDVHLKKNKVLEWLKTAEPNKCVYMQQKVKMIGCKVGANEIMVDGRK